MPSSQATATERRNDRTMINIAHEPPKLKTTLKTSPKQATNPLQFVKVGPCSLYRTAQEQLQKVQEVKKIKQEVRDDPEDWQSNLDNWKSSRRKRQEHIIERVVEVKKLELEEHDRQRRRSKTFSEMMEERGNRGRKLSMSLAMYHEEDSNDLSDLGIGTSSGKSSVSGDTHEDTQSVLSDRDSEIDKNHSDLYNTTNETSNNGNNNNNNNYNSNTNISNSNTNNNNNNNNNNSNNGNDNNTATINVTKSNVTTIESINKKSTFDNEFEFHNDRDQREYDSGTTATVSSPEPEELYTYDGAGIHGSVSCSSNISSNSSSNRVTHQLQQQQQQQQQNIPRRSLINQDIKNLDNVKLNHFEEKNSSQFDEKNSQVPVIKVDIVKRREIFEKASLKSINNSNKVNNNNNNNNITNNRSSGDFSSSKSIKERLSCLEKQKQNSTIHNHDDDDDDVDVEEKCGKIVNRLSGDMSTIRERLSHLEKQTTERESNNKICKPIIDNVETFTPLRDRLSILDKYSNNDDTSSVPIRTSINSRQSDEFSNKMRHRLCILDTSTTMHTSKNDEKKLSNKQVSQDTSQHQQQQQQQQQHHEVRNEMSTPSERSSSPDSEYRAPRAAFHRSLDSLDADASSEPDTFERVQSLEELDYARRRYPTSVSSAEILNDTDREDSGIHTADVSCSVSQADEPVDEEIVQHPGVIVQVQEIIVESKNQASVDELKNTEISMEEKRQEKVDAHLESAVIIEGTAEATGKLSTNKPIRILPPINVNNTNKHTRTVVYQSPRIPPRRNPPDVKSSIDSQTRDCESKSIELNTVNSQLHNLKSNESSTIIKPSKIPTPLPRKPIASSKPATQHLSPIKNTSKSLPSSPKSALKVTTKNHDETKEDVMNDDKNTERRRTVVEVCEKIIVPQGETLVPPPVTPFITVTKIGDEQQLHSNNEESIVIGSGSSSSTATSSSTTTTASSTTNTTIIITDEEVEPRCEPPKSVVHEENIQTSVSTTDSQIASLPVACFETLDQQDIDQDSESVSLIMDSLSLSPLEQDSNLMMDHYNKTRVYPSNIQFISPPMSLSKSIPQLNLTSNEEIIAGLVFPLGPPTSVEPPKEKPPPPPSDFSDEENQPIEPLKRLNSTRRIKKELRTRRSDFLGIEGINDDELELSLAKPPDMAAILAEERRIEQLHRRSYDTDSNYEQDSSHERDSGVELGQAEDWVKQPVSPDMSQHSRQSSEPFGASVTSSEEDEITKKEREIIEVLEKEEQWRYGNDREQNSDIGEKLAHKLRELEEEKMQLERERAQEAELQRQEDNNRKNDKDSRKQEEQLMRKQQEIVMMQQEMAHIEEMKIRENELRHEVEHFKLHDDIIIENESRPMDIRHREDLRYRATDKQINEQNTINSNVHDEDDYSTGEVLRVERELLQLEQEELKRQRNNMMYREQKKQQLGGGQLQEQWQSLQDVNHDPSMGHATYQNINNIINYRSSMPNLQLPDHQRRRSAPPPIPPAKPLRLLDQRQRDITIRNSRIPSADSIPQQVDATLRHSASASTLMTHAGQQMTKQTLHALSAVPRTRIVKGDQWVQRRKSDGPRIATQDFNYQHWLIQEAEQRRINEKNQRSPTARKPQQHITGTSVPYTGNSVKSEGKPLPDSIIQTLTQRIQNRAQERHPTIRRRIDHNVNQDQHLPLGHHLPSQHVNMMHQKVHQSSPSVASGATDSQEKMLSVSGKKKCSHCGDELGRGAAMIIESLRLFYHMECFKCCVCHVRLGDGLMGTDVRVRNHKLHCHNCYSSDDGVKFSCV